MPYQQTHKTAAYPRGVSASQATLSASLPNMFIQKAFDSAFAIIVKCKKPHWWRKIAKMCTVYSILRHTARTSQVFWNILRHNTWAFQDLTLEPPGCSAVATPPAPLCRCIKQTKKKKKKQFSTSLVSPLFKIIWTRHIAMVVPSSLIISSNAQVQVFRTLLLPSHLCKANFRNKQHLPRHHYNINFFTSTILNCETSLTAE